MQRTSLEERIATNHHDLMARIADVEIRSNDALNIVKNNEIIISDILRKHESLKGELNTKIVEITQKVKKKLSSNRKTLEIGQCDLDD